MYFANPWGLLGLLAIPLILFIHLFQRRFPRLDVGGLHLWISPEQVKTAGVRRDRIPITRSLILELLIAALLACLLAQPKLANLSGTTHWVFVLDDSASMLAESTDGVSFREKAIQEIEARVDDSGRGARVTLVLTGPRPTMLAGPAVDWKTARQALSEWTPQKTKHQFQAAWDMAAAMTVSSGKLAFLTDSVSDSLLVPGKMEVVSVGSVLPNLAFETARWSIDPASLQANLYLRIRNFGDSAADTFIIGSVNNQEIFRQQVELPASQSRPFSVPIPGGIKSVNVSLESSADRLATDSRLVLIEPGLRSLKYKNLLPPDHSAYSSIGRLVNSMVNVVEASSLEEADLVFSPLDQLNSVTESIKSNHVWQVSIGPASLDSATLEDATNTSGPFLVDRRNPILEGVALQGTIWSGIQSVPVGMSPMISVGPKILFGENESANHRRFLFNIDFQRSNFADSPDFPILFSNLIQQCRNTKPGLRRWNYQLNEIVAFQLDPKLINTERTSPLRMVHQANETVLPRLAAVELPPLTQTGVYEIFDQQALLARFAANFFDGEESDLSKLKTAVVAPRISSNAVTVETELSPWIWILLIGLGLALAIWNWIGLQTGAKKRVMG